MIVPIHLGTIFSRRRRRLDNLLIHLGMMKCCHISQGPAFHIWSNRNIAEKYSSEIEFINTAEKFS